MNIKAKQQIDYWIGNFLVAVNLVMAKSLGFMLRRDHSLKPPTHIAFVKMLGLGSMILCSDAVMAVRKKYPNAKCILICGKAIKEGMAPLGLFDEIWLVKDDGFGSTVGSAFKILFKCWRIKKLWVADLEVYSKLSTIFSLWTIARNRFGFYLNPVRFRISINTHNVYFNQFNNVEENYARLAQVMGAEASVAFHFPGFAPELRREEWTYPYIAFNNTCSDLSKERKMPEQLQADICLWILENTPYQVAFTGSPADYEPIQHFIQSKTPPHFQARVKNIAGTLSFSEYYAFLHAQCALMLTIDSAPLHIASRLGLPTLSLWGPTNPGNLTKVSERNKVLYLQKTCSPCVHHTETLPCGGDNHCMKDMTLAMVQGALTELMEKLKTTHASV